MTEEEARTKWCPMTRNPVIHSRTMSGGIGLYVDTCVKCFASDCMAWRWQRHEYAKGYEPKEDTDEYYEGYCGIGGRQ